ncbi:hypothetical protein HXY33_01495 [Candidatus Bathyarchaeota archaeon]|nr:hypothetical protein [Candidatus Bathyarchaeota archaeon]
MDNEVYTFAVKNTLNEIRNICPEITGTFMFREDGEIIAGDNTTSEKIMVRVVDSLDSIFEKSDAIGEVDCITFEGGKGRLKIFRVNDAYLVTASSEKADMKYVDTVTHVLVPTILKLLEKICSTPLQNSSQKEIEPKFDMDEEMNKPSEELIKETAMKKLEEDAEPEMESEIKPEASLPELPVNQLIVENLGGLLVPSDTVRIDNEILTQWANLYEDSKIEEVEIGTFDGKTTRCKVKPIKDSKYEGKGIIQMPEKVQLALEIKKGELVRASPIIGGGG